MKSEVSVKEYVRRLNDDDLRYLYFRFTQCLSGDRADASNFLSQDREMDRWLQSANNSGDFFDMLDSVGELVEKEYDQRIGKVA